MVLRPNHRGQGILPILPGTAPPSSFCPMSFTPLLPPGKCSCHRCRPRACCLLQFNTLHNVIGQLSGGKQAGMVDWSGSQSEEELSQGEGCGRRGRLRPEETLLEERACSRRRLGEVVPSIIAPWSNRRDISDSHIPVPAAVHRSPCTYLTISAANGTNRSLRQASLSDPASRPLNNFRTNQIPSAFIPPYAELWIFVSGSFHVGVEPAASGFTCPSTLSHFSRSFELPHHRSGRRLQHIVRFTHRTRG